MADKPKVQLKIVEITKALPPFEGIGKTSGKPFTISKWQAIVEVDGQQFDAKIEAFGDGEGVAAGLEYTAEVDNYKGKVSYMLDTRTATGRPTQQTAPPSRSQAAQTRSPATQSAPKPVTFAQVCDLYGACWQRACGLPSIAEGERSGAAATMFIAAKDMGLFAEVQEPIAKGDMVDEDDLRYTDDGEKDPF